ncbi:MAG TPA: hypothetical protein VF144_14380 [Chitinophagaceae bacterium]
MRDCVLIIATLISISACSNHSQDKEKADTAGSAITNSSFGKLLYVERTRYENPSHSLIVKSIYLIKDSLEYDSSYYCQGNYLYITNKSTKTIDSIELAEACGIGVLIDDVTQKLQFKNPIFNIATPGGSDTYINEFIAYQNDSLKKLFEILNYNTVDLVRKDPSTLTGFVKDRDEVIGDFQDYPITVSLNDYSVRISKSIHQSIEYETKALGDFEGYQISNGLKRPYLVKEGSTVLIDSFNRKTNIVRVIVDSVVIYVPLPQMKDKVQGNTAG